MENQTKIKNSQMLQFPRTSTHARKRSFPCPSITIVYLRVAYGEGRSYMKKKAVVYHLHF